MANEPKDDKVINEARERFRESQDGSEFNRNNYYQDTLFSRMGVQWPRNVRIQREQESRPCLTINKLPAFIRQVVNDARQNKPSIRVSPVDSGADVETAQVIGGLVRSIEQQSNADDAYDTAIDHAASGGYGFWTVDIEYAHDESFDMECRINRIPNPLMVHWDVGSTAFDASDWEYAFVSEFLTEEEYERDYPGAVPISFEFFDARDDLQYWINGTKIRLAVYWERTKSWKNLIQFASPDGIRNIREDKLPRLAKSVAEAADFDITGMSKDEMVSAYLNLSGMVEQRRRKVEAWDVRRRVINGVEVLEDDPWPGSMIPVIPLWGEEVISDGRRHFRSMIRDAKDSQQMFNFWRSASTELVALAPRAPYIGPKGFVPADKKEQWRTANTRSHPYLEYEPEAGAAPQRQPFAGVPAGVIQESLNASDDMKAITGIYDPSLGARSNETSGRAILARQRESDVSNFHFIDNQRRAIRYCGQVLVEIIPYVYSARQSIRILGEDMKEEVVNLTTAEGGANHPTVTGERGLYNISVGKYDVNVKAGPSYSTQREEAREVLVEIISRVPNAAVLLGDILIEHLDFVGAEKVAARLKMMLPPEVQQAEGISSPAAVPPNPGVSSLNSPPQPADPNAAGVIPLPNRGVNNV